MMTEMTASGRVTEPPQLECADKHGLKDTIITAAFTNKHTAV